MQEAELSKIRKVSTTLKALMTSSAAIAELEWTEFEQQLEYKQLAKGEILFHPGDSDLYLGFVVRGLLHSYYLDRDGQQYTKNFSWEGRFIAPWAAILQDKPANFTAEALEDTLLLRIRAKKFKELQAKYPRLEILGKRFTDNLLIDREKREFESLTLDNMARYQSFIENFKAIKDRIPQHMIATYIGITPVALSRLKNKSVNKC